jgi:hypothetical protein
VQLGVWDQPGQDASVDDRDDRVVVAGENERRLPDQAEKREAGPAGAGGQLVQVAADRSRADLVLEDREDVTRVLPGCAAVQETGDAGGVPGVTEAARREHAQQRGRLSGDHQDSGAGADQDQPAHPAPVLDRELLSERSTPRQSEYVDLVVPELGQHPIDHPGHPGDAVREQTAPRAADTGYVEADHRAVLQYIDDGLQDLEAGADTAAHQERSLTRIAGRHVVPDPAAAGGQGLHVRTPARSCQGLGLPGGLTSAAMWPLVDSTNRVSPPSSWVLR